MGLQDFACVVNPKPNPELESLYNGLGTGISGSIESSTGLLQKHPASLKEQTQ